jgi:hypothetical protein
VMIFPSVILDESMLCYDQSSILNMLELLAKHIIH